MKELRAYLYRNIPEPKEPIFLDATKDDKPIWENRSPSWKGSSTKGGRSEKQIKKDRKNKKTNKRKH